MYERNVLPFLLASIALTAAAATEAQAQEAGGAGQYRWDGLYNDVFIGGRFASSHQNFPQSTTGDYDVNGVTGGGGIGYNRRIGRLVVGVEANLSINSSDGAANAPDPAYNYETENTWLGVIESRLGYDFGTTFLPYVAAGLAVGDVRIHTYRPGSFGSAVDYTNVEPGWTIGAGVESPLSARWSVRGDYRYVSLADADGASSAGRPVSGSFDESIIRLGLVYHWR